MRRDWGAIGFATFISLMGLFLVVLLTWVVYCATTGGFTYTEKARVGGIVCVQVHDRLTGEVESVSCPPIQTKTP